MFRILDTHTGEWIKDAPWVDERIRPGYHTTTKLGKTFKRKSDLSNHISTNIKFYTKHGARFQVVEYELVETQRLDMQSFVHAKQDRDKVKHEQLIERQVQARQQQIDQLTAELDRLKGSP